SGGSRDCQARRPLASSGSTALSSAARRSAQRVADPWGSASASTVRRPRSAECAARWVATVVLPTPPLEPATRIVFIRRLLPLGWPQVTPPSRGRGRKGPGIAIFTPPPVTEAP